MADSSFRVEIEEIKALLSSEKTKALAYPKLLKLQETSAADSSSVQLLAYSSHAIVISVVHDIFENDEEIADQALKCLGFMVYHPTIVALISGDDANAIIESLVKVIVITKIKSVCNLGVWCLSIQQFGSSLLDKHFPSLLRAILHALDNPIGSLSTTFEAMQAVVKLTGLLPEQMRNTSSVWTPPIYRRLVSVDKRDRDMSEGCLLKIMPAICPPPIALSKALYVDTKKQLLLAMKQLLDQGLKIQSLKAWGWFMRLLGPYAMKKKLLINEMLKILEQTFSDFDSQVQIASLVAWEGLIDALIEPQVQTSQIHYAAGDDAQVLRKFDGQNSQNEADSRSKRIKLIMAPLIGIMSSKCDVSVHASCLSTWAYLLHKLEASISCQSVIETVWEPIIELVFQVGPENKNIWLLNFCLDLLNSLILGRDEETVCNQERDELPPKVTICDHLASAKCILRHYPISYSPWNLCHVNFFIKMISILVNHKSPASECGRLANEGALRLFRSLLEAIQISFRGVSITYEEVMRSLNTIFRFLTGICENVTSECDSNSSHSLTCLKFLEAVTETLEPSVLESPLYKVELDTKIIKKLECETEIRCPIMPCICCVHYEDRVVPAVYINILYYSVVVCSSVEGAQYESLLGQMQRYLKFLLSSQHAPEVLHTFIYLLYKDTTFRCLEVWVVLANSLTDWIDGKRNHLLLNVEKEDIGYPVVFHLLSYPFASRCFSQTNMEVDIVSEAWRLLFVSINRALQSSDCHVKSFSADLCTMLSGCIETEDQLKEKKNDSMVQLYGSAIICVLGQFTSLSDQGSHSMDCDGRKSNIKNCLNLAAGFMKLFWENKERTEPSFLSTAPRFLLNLVDFVRCLKRKEDIIVLIETMSSSLLEGLTNVHLLDENTKCQLQVLWTEILKSLQQSEPPMQFDSTFLKFQEPFLERTLDHPNPAISEPTINFWNSTYGRHMKLEFPQSLLPILDKLSRSGKLKLLSRSLNSLHRHTATATLNKCSKRVEIVGNGSEDFCCAKRRRRPELTEHQREVRRAQQGRSMDCNGHGPRIRTYTTIDFSQGNEEESQDSQDFRNVETILEMLRKEK